MLHDVTSISRVHARGHSDRAKLCFDQSARTLSVLTNKKGKIPRKFLLHVAMVKSGVESRATFALMTRCLAWLGRTEVVFTSGRS